MIGKAASISHGINDIRYITGESRYKEHPELIYHVKDNLLPCELDAQGIWDLMKAGAQMKKNVIRMEISPGREYTENFTMQDWQKLWDDFVREFDRIELTNESDQVYSHKTNIANSIYTVWLHYESDSGIPHLHAAVCRKDRYGKTNNDHNIHIRAQEAAQAVAIRRGWITAAEIHRINADKIADDLTEILRAMPSWSWEDYSARIRAKGYSIMIRSGKKGPYGYSIGMGKARFKASELGTGRKLTALRIEDTWNKLHSQSTEKAKLPVKKAGVKPVAPVVSKPIAQSDKQVADYTSWREETSRYELSHEGKTSRFYIPNDVMQVFDDEFDYREIVNWQELTDMAVALFVGLTALDTGSTGSGGGGSSNNNDNWRDRKDDDEIERARRCARVAAVRLGKTTKLGRKR